MKIKSQLCTLNLTLNETSTREAAPPEPPPFCPTRKRLEEGFVRLGSIQLVRNHRKDRYFQKREEERIIWRELLDLEVQALDERFAQRIGA